MPILTGKLLYLDFVAEVYYEQDWPETPPARTVAVEREDRLVVIRAESMDDMAPSYEFKVPMDPSDVKDYITTWQEELEDKQDTLEGAEFILPDDAVADGVEIDTQAPTVYGGVVFFKVASGEQQDERWSGAGKTYAIRHQIRTTGGRTYERSVALTIRQL